DPDQRQPQRLRPADAPAERWLRHGHLATPHQRERAAGHPLAQRHRPTGADGGRRYAREFFGESFSTDRYQFSFQPFTVEGSYAWEGSLQVTPITAGAAISQPL
ncbi:MAG: hypothetical protein ACKO5M_07690, partial [Vulcanococcus sp.]